MASNNMSNAPMPSTLRQGPPSAPLGAAPAPARLQQLQQILTRFEVSIAEANDLVILEDYEVVCILDDSGSMNLASQPATQRSLFAESKTRWQELQESVTLLVELANCFDKTGVDLFFLNRGLIDGVKTPKDERLAAAFRRSAAGGTPLTQSLRIVAEHCEGERPILLMIFTDGEPNGGVRQFEKELKRLVTKKSSDKTFKVQIMACTSDQDAVGYLNEIDEKFGKVDVTDDYYSEMQEVVMKARKRPQFTRGDWLMKARGAMVLYMLRTMRFCDVVTVVSVNVGDVAAPCGNAQRIVTTQIAVIMMSNASFVAFAEAGSPPDSRAMGRQSAPDDGEHLRELKLLEENLQTANRLCRLHRLDAARDGGSRCFEEEDVVAREDLPISRFPMLRLTSGSTFELSQDTMEYQEGAASGAVKYEEGAAPPHQVKFEEGTTTAATAPAQAVAVIPTMSSQGEGPLPRFGSSGSLNGSFFEADSYELCMGILILVSVMVLALEMQYEGYVIGYELQYPKLIHPPEEVWHQWPVVLRWMDRTFTGLFVLDIMMRVCVLRLRFFCQTLNLLDFVVVSCSLMEDIFGDNFPVNAPFLRLLRFAKVARSLRVLKRAHILGSLHLLLKSVRASVEVLFWSLCLLAIIQCIAGMLLAQSLQSFLADPLEDPEVRQEVFRYFGTFTSTLLTMFEVLMANWAPPCRILVDNVSEWYSLGFIIYRCLVGFAVLNVVSAVFLQQTMKVAAADQEVAMQQRQISAEAYTKKLEAFFKRLDESGDGVLTWKEFSAVLGSPKLQNWMATLELESHDLVNLFNMIDDGDGEISLEDFLHGARHLHGCASSIAVAEVMATARRTETKTEALLLMLANLTGTVLRRGAPANWENG
ncbi:Ankyrin-2 [Durusdinium trenchii]|uniref:Ankyrin-2 n=1 Tax=Durusdinium trenchii TaxID=1381693 RepID=A0ABP0RYY4_9DINO